MKNLYLLLVFISALHLNIHSVEAANASDHCATQPGICWAVGDPHVRRFNAAHYLFSTSGKVLLVSDRKSIWVRMALKNTGRATQILNVYIDYIWQDGSRFGKRTKIVFQKDEDHVQINYRVRPLPYEKWGIKVTPVRFGTLVDAPGIHIKWLNSARLFVTMGTEYVGKVDGECGIYCNKPPGRGYSSSKRNRVTAGLRLNKPYNEDYSNIDSLEFGKLATEVENSIRTLYDPTFVDVTVVGAKKGSTVVICNITLNEDDDQPSENIQKEIQTKLVSGKDKYGHTLGDLLHEEILDCEVSPPEIEMSENDYDIEPEISASDEEDDAEAAIQDQSIQGQGSPYFGQNQNSPNHQGDHDHHDDHDHDHAYNNDHHTNHEDHAEHFTHAPDNVEHNEEHDEHEDHDEDEEDNDPLTTDCAKDGEEYADGSTIEESYGTCTCNKGKWECQNGFGICGLWGPDNIETFDEKHLRIDGECRYFLVSDCGHPPKFSVSTEERYDCTENKKEKKRALLLTVGDNRMRIGSKYIVYNGEHIEPPRNLTVGSGGVIEVTEDQKKVKINLNNDLVIEWNRKLFFGITLRRPQSRNSTCGMCGNFNGDSHDDSQLPEYVTGCREKHPGCHKKDNDFVYPKQVYNVSCDDIEKVEFPVYHGEGCKKIKVQLLNQCQTCVADIPNACIHPSNLGCIKQKEKTCVTDLFAHFLRTCYTQVFTGAATGGGGGKRKKRHIRAAQLKDTIGSIDAYKMSIDDINKRLRK